MDAFRNTAELIYSVFGQRDGERERERDRGGANPSERGIAVLKQRQIRKELASRRAWHLRHGACRSQVSEKMQPQSDKHAGERTSNITDNHYEIKFWGVALVGLGEVA